MKYAEYCQQVKHLKMSIDDILSALNSRPIKRWALIKHDRDETEEHIHVFMEMQSDQTPESISKWFNDEPNRIEKGKKKSHTFENMVAYGLHRTNTSDGKYQYEVNDYTANFDVEDLLNKASDEVLEVKSRKQRNKEIEEILDKICNNEIPRIRISDYLTNLEQIRHKMDIETAYKIRDTKLARKEDRQMDVIYIYGQPGTGKTTFAKMLGRNKGYDVFISGSSNDPLEGYQGQECVILDDVRGSDWKINDLLKLLDNHTNSLVKSRYSNKLLIDCKLLILTSVQQIEDLYSNLRENESEPIEQLKRRCRNYILMTKDTIKPYVWNDITKQYDEQPVIMNPVPMVTFITNNQSVLEDVQNLVNAVKKQAEEQKND